MCLKVSFFFFVVVLVCFFFDEKASRIGIVEIKSSICNV
jgi:hypothetical protein